ncbi:bifunctional proline dehydrogenase/L-glutamate gamma-semialdehyde dehydrogenase PutA [Methylomonas sp. MgM2]
MENSDSLLSLYQLINPSYVRTEAELLSELTAYLGDYDRQSAADLAAGLIADVRGRHFERSAFDAFLQEYSLNSEEGIVLMGMAEALLRIPDVETQRRFLQEKLAEADWHSHLMHSDSVLVNLASTALLLSGKMEERIRDIQHEQKRIFDELLSRLGEPLIRNAVKQAMQHLAKHFVIAETIEAALDQAKHNEHYRYSFDMLGEAALTEEDAERYYQAYAHAIETLSSAAHSELFANPGISVKLSALYPRYEVLQHKQATAALSDKLLSLVKIARAVNIGVTVDAEEAERLDMSLQIFSKVWSDPGLNDWSGLGLAVQAYQKRAFPMIGWLAALAGHQRRLIPVRLVKGAYWDSEIKRAQENGWQDYPVYTRKAATDVSYLACARLMLSRPDRIYPQFATHNAHSVAAVCCLGRQHPGFEFQRLHGMGEVLYDELLSQRSDLNCRVYAPVGLYRDLLPYLVRRLLENGANTSFIHQIENPAIGIDQLVRDPVEELHRDGRHPPVKPPDLFAPQRKNSEGLNLADLELIRQLEQDLRPYFQQTRQAAPLVAGELGDGKSISICSPFDRDALVGKVVLSKAEHIEQALSTAYQAFRDWRLCPVEMRASYLLKAADLLERNRLELLALCMREGGKTLRDASAEVREAVDLCRYYAAKAVELYGEPQRLPGPTGEDNRLFRYGRGVFVCISPWNFPIAIFVGQIAAALASGNSVIAKPALQTSLTAMTCVKLLHEAGVPTSVLQLLPGEGAEVGRHLLSDSRVAGVAFTGSSATAQIINRQLAARSGAIAAFIAETGGQNVMLADSSAHEEQLIADALQSAFNSAGQRCSALRVLFLPEETADRVVARLIGAMRLIRVGSPVAFDTDIGPVIDEAAIATLTAHVDFLQRQAKVLYRLSLSPNLSKGFFFPPTLAEIPALSLLEQEVFGPILHIVRYRSGELDRVIDAINATGYGLTLGLHTRINATVETVRKHARVGNVYVNRNMIGAVVGVQPFGGMGLSGTGPKAGGPDYLQRFSTEQTLSTNIAAIGGNPWLLGENTA